MTHGKEIHKTDTYRDCEYSFEGIPILVRHYFAKGAVHIRVDEGFARANGFGSLAELHKTDPLMSAVQWVDAELFGQGLIAAVIDPVPASTQKAN